MKTIGIAGLGLIGGSMAKSIKKHTDCCVLGVDANSETMIMALMSGAVDEMLTNESIARCDLIILALPPRALLDWAEKNAPLIPEKAILTDMCGVKRVICDRLERLAEENGFIFVGGHPMAGKEVAGFENADSSLFEGADMILTTGKSSQITVLDMLKSFFIRLGFGRVTFATPEEHDKNIAYTSQLAHISSSAYIKSPTAQLHTGFSAGSFKDMTRVAKLDPNLWTELFEANSDNLITELEGYISHLNEYMEALKAGDKSRVKRLLADGRNKKISAGMKE